MKTTKPLIFCTLLCMFYTGNAFSQCIPGLFCSLSPGGQSYHAGDTIEYVISLSIPDYGCDIRDIRVYFYAPNNPPSGGPECDATNGVLVFEGGSLEFGDPPIVLTGSESSELTYEVDGADADSNGFIRASYCAKYNIITGPIYEEGFCTAIVSNMLVPITSWCWSWPEMDFNKDCKVDLIDLATFVQFWLKCNRIPESDCLE